MKMPPNGGYGWIIVIGGALNAVSYHHNVLSET